MNYENFKMVNRANFDPNELKNYGCYLSTQQHSEDLPDSIIFYFDSARELVECCEKNISAGYWLPNAETGTGSQQDWCYGKDGYNTHNLTRQALLNGQILDKHMKLVSEYKDKLFYNRPVLANLQHIAQLNKRRRSFNENDGELDIDRYLSGDTNIWCKRSPTSARGMVCRFHYDQATSCQNDFKSFIEGMAWAVAIVEIIEQAGISVEFTFGMTSRDSINDAKHTSIVIRAKSANEPFDVSRLMSFGLSGMLRRYGFDVKYNCDLGKGLAYDYGKPMQDIPPVVREFIDADIFVKNGGAMNEKNINLLIDNVTHFFESRTGTYKNQ